MDDAGIRDLLATTEVIAVVGLSPDPSRPSHQVAAYLNRQGYRLYGVNPRCDADEVFGVPVLPSLDQVPEPIDLVDVFRRPEFALGVAHEAATVGAKALWLQLGIRSPEARTVATTAGMAYVEDRCTQVEHARLL